MSATLALLVLAWIAILVLALGLGGLMTHVRDLNDRMTRMQMPAQTEALTHLPKDLAGLALPAIVLLVRPGCQSCDRLLMDIMDAPEDVRSQIRIGALEADESLTRHGPELPQLIPRTTSQQIVDELRIQAFPTAIAIDHSGEVVNRAVGATAKTVLSIVQKMTSEAQ